MPGRGQAAPNHPPARFRGLEWSRAAGCAMMWPVTPAATPHGVNEPLPRLPESAQPMWLGEPVRRIDLRARLSELPPSIHHYSGPAGVGALVCGAPSGPDGVLIASAATVLGRAAVENILNADEGTLSSYVLDPQVTEALPQLWRSGSLQRLSTAPTWPELRIALEKVQTSGRSLALSIATRGGRSIVALFLDGALVASYSDAAPVPAEGVDHLRTLLDLEEADADDTWPEARASAEARSTEHITDEHRGERPSRDDAAGHAAQPSAGPSPAPSTPLTPAVVRPSGHADGPHVDIATSGVVDAPQLEPSSDVVFASDGRPAMGVRAQQAPWLVPSAGSDLADEQPGSAPLVALHARTDGVVSDRAEAQPATGAARQGRDDVVDWELVRGDVCRRVEAGLGQDGAAMVARVQRTSSSLRSFTDLMVDLRRTGVPRARPASVAAVLDEIELYLAQALNGAV